MSVTESVESAAVFQKLFNIYHEYGMSPELEEAVRKAIPEEKWVLFGIENDSDSQQ